MSLRDLRRHVGQFLMIGFAGPAIPTEVRALAREFDLGGVVLFKRNVEEPAQVAELAYEARQLSPETPLWVAVDQEGGRVARLRAPFTEWPPMATLGRAGDPDLVRRFAAALAKELVAVGITMDFAPVLDVATNPKNPVIGDRAIADDAARVADYGRIIIEELQNAGIAACGKHFPGHGDSSVDSHEALPILEQPSERFQQVEFVPFRAAVEAGVAAMMVGHLLVPAFDEQHPASISPAVVTGRLRHELKFDRLVCTDDMETMKAMSARGPLELSAVEAIAAGVDVVLACGVDHALHARILEAIIYAGEQGAFTTTQIDDGMKRQRRAKERFLAGVAPRPPAPSALAALLGSPEHEAVARRMAEFA